MNEREIVEFWGSENLTRWSLEAVRDLRISETSKSFLMTVGLPSPRHDRLWEYDFNCGQPSRVSGEEHLVVVMSLPRPFCIDEKRDNSIVAPYVEKDMERFVNSTVEQFVAFLTVFERGRQEMRRLGNTEQEPCRKVISEMEGRMKNIDPAALEGEENYWSVVLEDMRYPYLTDAELDAL